MAHDDEVYVILAHPHDGKNPREKVAYSADTARGLVDVGYARYASMPDAREAGGDAHDPTRTATAK